ncbi:MAG: hypothetical protein Q9170_004223 [Blastenia crenularia]
MFLPHYANFDNADNVNDVDFQILNHDNFIFHHKVINIFDHLDNIFANANPGCLNGNFQTLTNGKADPWLFTQPMNSGTGQTSSTGVGSDNGNNYGLLTVNNAVDPGFGSTSTAIYQTLPHLCYGTQYTLTYSSQITIRGGDQSHACSVTYSLSDIGQLVFIGPPNGDPPPFDYQTRSYTFTYFGSGDANGGDTLSIQLSCNAPGGTYRVDDVSLIGTG